MADAVVAPPAATAALEDLGVSPDELMAAIKLIQQAKADEAAREEAKRVQRETGYPKPLYNPVYPGESVLLPTSGNRLKFVKGKIEVKNAEEEAILRAACKGRIYERDLPTEKTCSRCQGFVTGSSEALSAHIERQHMP